MGNAMALTNHHISNKEIALESLEIAKAQEDPKAFKVLYERYYVDVFRFVFHRLGDETKTAEVVSNVFLKAIENIKQYQPRGVPFKSWLLRISSNEVNNLFRRKKQGRVVYMNDESSLELVSNFGLSDEDGGETLDRRKGDLRWAMKQLPDAGLQLIEMRFFEKRSFREIGEILDVSEANAKVKTYRTIDILKRLMKVDNKQG